MALGLSESSCLRLLNWGLQADLLERTGKGPRTRYAFK